MRWFLVTPDNLLIGPFYSKGEAVECNTRLELRALVLTPMSPAEAEAQ